MPRDTHVLLLVLAFGLALSGAAAGQASNPDDKVTATTDVWDLVARLRHKPPRKSPPPGSTESRKPSVVFAPSIGYQPVTGLSFGAGGNIAFTVGASATTRLSSISAAASVTLKKYLNLGADFGIFTGRNNWYFNGTNAYQVTAQDTHGLGPHTTSEDAILTTFHFLRLYETAYRKVFRSIFVGAGVNVSAHTNVEPGKDDASRWNTSPYVRYTARHGFDLAGQRSSGVGVSVLIDSRDSSINPDRGWFANAIFRGFFKGFLAGDADWQELVIDCRTYARLTRDARHKLAIRAYADLVTGGIAPYFDLPAIGMDSTWRSGRGYSEGRFRGEQLLYGELEYRATLTKNGLVGLVAFLNATTVTNSQSHEQLFDVVSPAAGFGFRLLVNKRSKTNLCLDIGFGSRGSHGAYLAIQEAF
jgi:outer membrane protein assembly factor BamA